MKKYLTILASLASTAIFPQAGFLDQAFGSGGIATFPPSSESTAYAVAVQEDGKIVTAGFRGLGGAFTLARFNVDGSFDETFNGSGWVTTSSFGGGSDGGNCFSVLVQPDGKILASGYFDYPSSQQSFGMVRYNSDGSLDGSFGTGGIVITWIGTGNCTASRSVLQGDGKILTVGKYGSTPVDSTVVVRYLDDGTVDESFGTDGQLRIGAGSRMIGSDIAVQPDGRIMVVGNLLSGSNWQIFVFRADQNGIPDPLFGDDGLAIASMDDAFSSEVVALALQPDGKAVVCGRTNAALNYDALLLRFNTDGSLDNTFDQDGMVSTAFSYDADAGFDVLVQPDGKILLVGYSMATNNLLLARYSSAGSLDPSFGVDGRAEAPNGVAYSIGLLADGRIILAGRYGWNGAFSNTYSVYCYQNDLSVSMAERVGPDQSIWVSPNPTASQLSISFNLAKAATVELEIRDILGRSVFPVPSPVQYGIGAHCSTLDVTGLPSGTYVLRMRTSASSWTRRFVKE